MTLKEKVAEVEPENADSTYAGAFGCPCDYDFLNAQPIQACYEHTTTIDDCTACWNREYKEDNHAV